MYWQAIGDAWEAKTDLVEITVQLPQEIAKGDIYIWGHGLPNGRAIINDGKTLRFTANNLPPKQFAEIRVLFPSRIVSGPVTKGNRLQTVINEERTFQEQTATTGKLKVFGIVFAGLFILIWTSSWFVIWQKYGREYPLWENPQYVKYPPSKIAPALVEALLSQEQRVTPNAFAATILDLARRKIISIEAQQYYTKGFLGVGSHRAYNYILHLKAKNPREVKGLADFEISLLEFVFDPSVDGQTVFLDDFKNRMKNSPIDTKRFFESWQTQVKADADRQDFVEDQSKNWRRKFFVGNMLFALVLYLIAALLFQLSWEGLWLVTILGGASLCVLSNFFLRWEKHTGEEARKWLAFKRYLNDFTHFKDELPQALVIWEDILEVRPQKVL